MMRSLVWALYIITSSLAVDLNGIALAEGGYESTLTVTTTPTSTITSTVSSIYNGSQHSLVSTSDTDHASQTPDTPTCLVVEPVPQMGTAESCSADPAPTSRSADASSSAAAAAAAASAAKPHACALSYAVQRGDTCEGISVEKGLSLVALIKLNPGLHVEHDGSCPLTVGRKLCVRRSALPPPHRTPSASSSSSSGGQNASAVRVTPVSGGDGGRAASTLPLSLASPGGGANYSVISSSLLPLGTSGLLSAGHNLTATVAAAGSIGTTATNNTPHSSSGGSGNVIDPSPLVVHPVSEDTPAAARLAPAAETKVKRGGLWEKWLPTSFRTSTVRDGDE